MNLLYYILEICQTHGLSVPSSVRSVQKMIKNALGAPASSGGDEASLTDLKKSYAAEKAQ